MVFPSRLWNHQLVALWADNVALESLTLPSPDSQYQLGADAEMEGDGSMHRRMLALFGMGIGELFTFEELSKDCAKDGVYEFMVTAKPLNMPGLVASPANAYAIK